MADYKPPLPQAFPESQACYGGMTLRDWFAGQAIIATAANWTQAPSLAVRTAYEIADMMLIARDALPPASR